MVEQFYKGEFVKRKDGNPPPVMQVKVVKRLADGTVEIYCEWLDNPFERPILRPFRPDELERTEP